MNLRMRFEYGHEGWEPRQRSGGAARFRGDVFARELELTCMAAEKNQDATSIPLEALKRVATDSAVAYVVEGVYSISSNGSGSR